MERAKHQESAAPPQQPQQQQQQQEERLPQEQHFQQTAPLASAANQAIWDASSHWRLQGQPAEEVALDTSMSLSRLVCRRPPVEAPHRSSFCGPRGLPPGAAVPGQAAATGACSPAAWPADLPLMQALPSTPRSADAGAQHFPSSVSPTPSAPLGAAHPCGMEGHGAAHDRGAGGGMMLEQMQSRVDGAPVILRPRFGSSTGCEQWLTPMSGPSQPLAERARDTAQGHGQHRELEEQGQAGTKQEAEGQAEAGAPSGVAAARAADGPASTVISCVSPSDHRHMSSADSPHRAAPRCRQGRGSDAHSERAAQWLGCAEEEQAAADGTCGDEGDGHVAADDLASAAEHLAGGEATFAPAALDAFCDVALAPESCGCDATDALMDAALREEGDERGGSLQAYCSIVSPQARRESCATVTSQVGPAACEALPAARPAAATPACAEAVHAAISSCSGAVGAETELGKAGALVEGSGAAEAEDEGDTGLARMLASTFMDGLESVDWYVVVQDAYGVDPEELLLQQRGLEEGQDEEEEQQGLSAWNRGSIQGMHRH